MHPRTIMAVLAWGLMVLPTAPGSPAMQNHRSSKDAEKACGAAIVYDRKHPGVVAPKKTKHVAPAFPDTTGHLFTGTPFVFEVTINASGKVCYIRTVREPKIDPPLPSFAEAIRDSIRRSQYRRGTKDGKPATVRMIVTTLINLS